ncbi:hypothetical protein QQS21_003119 [Conoideocrella luteorostrata]|uniref:HRQ family protein 2 n=1 Tax=Conoideocrella luteorostrata TaxID=1105319 RepID=A0AAJ0G2G2_9HYPO|nr:hypothetical protein QQS21_003119 [Conoideocrella luteorostrata]
MASRFGNWLQAWIRPAASNYFTLVGAGLVLLTAIYTLALIRRKDKGTDGNNKIQTRHEKVSFGPDAVDLTIEPLRDFDWKAKEPTKYLPIKPVYHITMGLQQDTPSNLITIDKDYLDRVTHRRHLIEEKGSAVHGHLPRGKESVSELYTYLLREYLPVRYPTMFRLSSDASIFENLVTGASFPVNAPSDINAALRALGESVEEDIFLLHETPEGHLCVAFMCCFPAGFDPSVKFGNLLKDIHAPVPSYDKIGSSMERFFSKLQVGKSVKRLNWSFQTHNELYTLGNHIKDESAEVTTDSSIDADNTFLRVELQTLTRLPNTQAVLFSFKTYLYSARQVKEDGSGPELADAIEGLKLGNAPGMWRYKSAVRWGKPVCEYLRS